MNELAEYMLDNYGTCTRGADCSCLRLEWLGRACVHWRPAGVKSFDELALLNRQTTSGLITEK